VDIAPSPFLMLKTDAVLSGVRAQREPPPEVVDASVLHVGGDNGFLGSHSWARSTACSLAQSSPGLEEGGSGGGEALGCGWIG
jgi:hypothetical protein